MARTGRILLAVVALAVVGAGALLAAVRSDAPVTVVYVGAHDCPTCPGFERAVWQPFVASALGRSVAAREVHVRSFRRTNDPGEWPEDLRWMIDASEIRGGTPTVLVFKGDRLAARGGGHMWSSNLVWRIRLAVAGWHIDPRAV